MKVNFNTTAAFDVDAQRGFTPLCPEELPVPDGDKIVDELNEQAKFSRLRIGSKDAHPPNAKWIADKEHPQFTPIDSLNMDMYWNAHCIIGTEGFKLLHGLPEPECYDFFVWKGMEPNMHPYGACYHDLGDKQSTGVIEYLRTHVNTIIVGGLATDYCVKTTVLQLLAVGYKVIINKAACRGVAKETVTTALYEMKAAGGILIDSVAELEAK